MHMRTLFVASAIGLSLACVVGLASGQQIYKWKDASGVIHFSQTPPATGTHYSKMQLTAEPDVSSNPPPAASAEPNQAGDSSAPTQAAAPKAAPADTPANRAALCKQLTSNISLLQSKQPVVTGAPGKQMVMSDNARDQQLATARAQQTQYCSGKKS
ncbi:MAG TPA: DUF4124 domain-containing protein [Rhodanobacteraceae bacterium]